ncbi:phage minor capsid protein [Streptococcus ruminantium]|uniref:phage minor capsid protein n=1 Tax=Streptococcus ruminantium TaxID=1917441 RepID=UPI0012DEA946|nr:phage minor capsid protein [Streptococcus ruminantium]
MSKLPFEQGDEQFTLEMNQVADVYHQLSIDLFINVIRRLKKRGTADLQREPYIWQLEKLNDMHMLTESNVKLIASRSEVAESVLRDVIANEGYKVYEDTHEQLKRDTGQNIEPKRYIIKEALESYANQTTEELGNLINTRLPLSVQEVYRAIIEQTVAGVVSGSKSAEQALNDTLTKWSDKGFYGFTDKAGRNWRADTYARNIIKTTSLRVYRDMRERPAEEFGVDTFYYSMKSSARAMCSPLQHQIVTKGPAFETDGTRVLSLLDYGYGTAGGCLGINCGHYLTPFIIGVNQKPDLPDHLKGISQKQAEDNARAEAQQRAFEREIRRNKERLKIAREIGDNELIQKYKLRGLTLNSQYKAYLDDHRFLYRNINREGYIRNAETYQNTYEILDNRLKKEYSNILQNLGDRAPKSYSDFKSLSSSERESLRYDNRIVSYFKGEIQEKLTEKQKQQAVEAYFNFKKDGIVFGDHAIARYIERMRRKNGTFVYNYETVRTAFSLPPNYVSDRDGRDVRYYNHLLYITEPQSDIVVTMMKRKNMKGFTPK